jgi:CubicO group peptidase (beta-lactamase class C family)
MRLAARLAGLLLAAADPSRASSVMPQSDLEAYVGRVSATFEVPGIGISIVEGNHMWARGYGIEKMGQDASVDEHTLFPIGSNTKAFTVAALAMLVDEGKLRWDDHVEDVLPGFRLFDPYASHELTVRDLLTHRSGLGTGEGDLMIFPQTNLTRQEIVDHIRFLPPKTSFRSIYAYDNVLYIVAGALVERLAGEPWESFVARRIFVPLGMNDTVSSFGQIKTTNRAWPHARTSQLIRGTGPASALPVVPLIDNEAPAGAINASARDMTRWLFVQLHRGQLPGSATHLYSEQRADEMWQPQVIEPAASVPKDVSATAPNMTAYALGWNVTDYRGHHIITHGGAVYGGISSVVLIPELQTGFVVMTNAEERYAVDAIVDHLLDHYLGAGNTDWIAPFKKVRDDSLAEAQAALKGSTISSNRPGPSLPLATYVGVYRDPWYGTVTVNQTASGLSIRFDRTAGMSGPLEHVDHDTFRTRWTDPTIENAYITFSVGQDRRVVAASMKAISPLADFSFDFQDLVLTPERGMEK